MRPHYNKRGWALRRVQRDVPRLEDEKEACERLFGGGGRYGWEGQDSVRGNRWCLWNVAYAPVP